MSFPNEPAPPESQGGCANVGCFGGCLIVGGLLLVIGLCAGGGFYFWASSRIANFTAEQPVELPTVELPDDQIVELETRINTFKQAVETDAAPDEDLVLTAEEINALISKDDALRGKVFVNIKDGQITGDVSIPTDPLPGGKGRYFNGSVTFDVSMEGGVLIVRLVDAKVGDEQVPQAFLDAVSKENFAKDLYKDADNAKIMQRFESIAVQDDKIVLKLRRDQSTSSSAEDSTAGPEDVTAEPTDSGAEDQP